MKDENKEKRYAPELRADGEDRIISGTAIVFNKESVLLDNMFTEIILPEAVTAELIANSDILMLYGHEDDTIPMARSKKGTGSLNIAITSEGVDFNFEARKTPNGEEALAAVRAKDLDSCSFAFTVAEGGDEWMSKPDGTYLRTIKKIEALYDFSLVNYPAYIQASCRSLDKFKAEQRSEPPADPPAADPPATDSPAADPIADYYVELEGVITKFSE